MSNTVDQGARPESKRSKVLNKVYKYTSDKADQNVGKKRGLAAGTAASVLGMGIDKYDRPSSEFEDETLDDEELSVMRDMSMSAEDEQKGSSKSSHFMDSFVERILRHTVPSDDQEMLEEKLKDPERTKRPGLSIRIIVSNFKKLSAQMGSFFEIQYGLIHLITWKKPTKTLSFLVLYTSICLWPHLLLALPLLFVLFGIMIPAYIHRHPMRTQELIKVRKRGQSLFEFFNQSSDDSIVADYLSDDFKQDPHSLRPISSHSSESSTTAFTQPPVSAATVSTDPIDINQKLNKSKRAKYVKSQMSLMINMRDLQNLTTDLIVGMDHAQQFWFETAGFKDERLSTFIFYIVAIATYVVLFLGRFIPWRFLFIQSGWAGIILCHPHSKKFLLTIKENRKQQALKAKLQKRKAQKESQESLEAQNSPIENENESAAVEETKPKKFDRHDIIIDDTAEIRVVDIYELEIKSLTKNQWSFYRYTNGLFDSRDQTRLSGKKPLGVEHLSKVLPPPDWKFDFGYENNWKIDIKPTLFLQERQIDITSLKVHNDETEGWIYDILKDSKTSDSVYEFRRRRLTRDCFRYSRPPKQPKPV